MFPWYLQLSWGDLVFLILLFSSNSLHCSLKKAFLFLLIIVWNSTFIWVYLSLSPLPFTSLVFSVICKASSENHFAFLLFFLFGFGHSLMDEPPSIVLQARCLSDLISWIYLLLPLDNRKGFNLGHTWRSSGFPWRNMVHWRREWPTTPVFWLWEPHEQYEKVRGK